MDPNVTAPITAPGADSGDAELRIERGACHVLYSYDVGLAIDLDKAERHIAASRPRGTFRQKRRTPYYFEYQPPPLRVSDAIEPLSIAELATNRIIELVIYDFGAVTVQFSIPLHGDLSRLLDLSEQLWDHEQLLYSAARAVQALLTSIAPAVTKPQVSEIVEDYCIYQLEALAPDGDFDATLAPQAGRFAQVLRAERTPLSQQEITDATAHHISFGRDDRTLIDWNAALLIGPGLDDVRAVLEYANVELLEMRYLDDRLDVDIDQAYEALTRRAARRRSPLPGVKSADMWRIAGLQMDSAMLYEGVNNALKLLGDQYLARVHRLAAQRFHLQEWDSSIRRKLQTIESIYAKLTDRSAALRLEVLEWIIIILIAVSILMPFIPGLARH